MPTDAQVHTRSETQLGESNGRKAVRRANLNKSAHTDGGNENTNEKMAKRKRKAPERETAAQAQRKESAPSGNTNRPSTSMIRDTMRKDRKNGRVRHPQMAAHTHCRKRQSEETTAKLSKQTGAGRRMAVGLRMSVRVSKL